MAQCVRDYLLIILQNMPDLRSKKKPISGAIFSVERIPRLLLDAYVENARRSNTSQH